MKKIIFTILLLASFSSYGLNIYDKNNFSLDIYGNLSAQIAMYGKIANKNGKVTNNYDAKIEDNNSKVGFRLSLSNEAKTISALADLSIKIRTPQLEYGISLDTAKIGFRADKFGTLSLGFMADIIKEYILDDMQLGFAYFPTRMPSSAYVNNLKNKMQRTGQARYDSPVIYGLRFSLAAQVQPKSWGGLDKEGKVANTFAYQIGVGYKYNFIALNGKLLIGAAVDSNGNDTFRKVDGKYYKNFSYGTMLGYDSDYFGIFFNYQGYVKHAKINDINHSVALAGVYKIIKGLHLHANTNILIYQQPKIYALDQDINNDPEKSIGVEYSLGINYAVLEGFNIYAQMYSKLVPDANFVTNEKPYMPIGAALGLKFEF